MLIWLIRHGAQIKTPEDVYRYYDPDLKVQNEPLSPRGRDQAKALARRLVHVPFDRVVASVLIRARETAGFLVQNRSLTLEVDPRLREIDMGALNLHTWDDYPEDFERWKNHEEDLPYPDGECGTDVWNRCQPALEELAASDAEHIAVVCHGGVIRCVTCAVLGLPQQNRFRLGHPPVHTSITMLHVDNGEWSIHTFNDYAHLFT